MLPWLESAWWDWEQNGVALALLLILLCLIAGLAALLIHLRRLRRDLRSVAENATVLERKLRNADRDMQALFDPCGVVVLLLDQGTDHVLYASQRALTLFGAGSVDVLNETVFQNPESWAGEPYDWNRFKQSLAEAKRTDIPEFEWRFSAIDGASIWLECSLSCLNYRGTQVTMLMGVDLTARKQAEAFEQRRRQVLSVVASDRPLVDILQRVVTLAEASLPGARCAIMGVDDEGRHLRWLAGSDVPADVVNALDGMPVQYGTAGPGTAAFSGVRVVSQNLAQDEHWHEQYQTLAEGGFHACWSEPVKGQHGEVIGTFDVYHSEPWAPQESDIEVLTSPVFLASLAIERDRGRRRLEQWLESEREVRKISTHLLSAGVDELTDSLDRTCAALGHFFNTDAVFLVQFDPAADEWRIINEWSEEGQKRLNSFSHEQSNAMFGSLERPFEQAQVLLFDRNRPLTEPLRPIAERLGVGDTGSVVLAGIYEEGQLTGLLGMSRSRTGPSWTEERMENVRLMANLLGSAMTRERLVTSLTHQAVHDQLTGLFNRHKLESFMEQEVARCERYGLTFSLILFDLDHFKSINDRFGHNEGDSVLESIGSLIQSGVRGSEIAGRWCGEEFLILLPETPLQSAALVAERIRKKVEMYEFTLPEPVTISVGVAGFESGDTPQEMVKRADTALYAAKEQGRNCVRTAGE